MRHRLIRIGCTLLVSTVIALYTSSVAHAGQRENDPITVDTTSSFAAGSLGSARNSSDANQSMYCATEAYPSGSFAFCTATNANGVSRTCSTSAPELIHAVESINGDSFVIFGWDTAGNCSYIYTYSGSLYAPKAP